jgi:structural hemagglutinin/hemolysin toxin protein RtxA
MLLVTKTEVTISNMRLYQLYFYVPLSHLETTKQALFAAGAGVVGNYAECAWQTKGQGQFKPLSGSQAFLGELQQLEKVTEYKVEMVCAADKLKAVLNELIRVHPYETPAYGVLAIQTLDDLL